MMDHARRFIAIVMLLGGLAGGFATADYSWIGLPDRITDVVVVKGPIKALFKYDPHNFNDKHDVLQSSTLIRTWATAHNSDIKFLPNMLKEEDFKDTENQLWQKAYFNPDFVAIKVPSVSIMQDGATKSINMELPSPEGRTDAQYEDDILTLLKKYGGD